MNNVRISADYQESIPSHVANERSSSLGRGSAPAITETASRTIG